MPFVAYRGKKLVRISLEFISLLMWHWMRELTCVLFWAFGLLPTLGKYLDFPIKHNATPQDFGFIIDRVQSRLANWKANLISFAGQLVLTQAVTTTIPNYVMQCVALPVKILNSVDRLSRNFLWGSSERKKKKFNLLVGKRLQNQRKMVVWAFKQQEQKMLPYLLS